MQPRVPAAAFGGEGAQAVSGLGRTVAGAGDEIFSRAIALQNLQNAAEATEADDKLKKARNHRLTTSPEYGIHQERDEERIEQQNGPKNLQYQEIVAKDNDGQHKRGPSLRTPKQ